MDRQDPFERQQHIANELERLRVNRPTGVVRPLLVALVDFREGKKSRLVEIPDPRATFANHFNERSLEEGQDVLAVPVTHTDILPERHWKPVTADKPRKRKRSRKAVRS